MFQEEEWQRMSEIFDIGVIGGGIVGLSAGYHAARVGKRTLLFERHHIGHGYGQSHDDERAVSVAYDTVERVRLALQYMRRWYDLERELGEQLFFQTGGIDIVDTQEERATITKTRDAMRALGVYCEEWDYSELKSKLPMWNLPKGACALYSPADGILRPTRTVVSLANQASCLGVRIHDQEHVRKVIYDGSKIRIITAHGRYTVKNLIVACGVWVNQILAHLNFSLPVETTQEQTVYFRPKNVARSFSAGLFPMWYHHRKPAVYGFPVFERRGIKVGFHLDGPKVALDEFIGVPRSPVTDRLRAYLEEYLPDAAGSSFGERACLYDITPDGKSLFGSPPGMPNVYVLSGFNGSGFGPAIAIGQAPVDLIVHGMTEICIEQFRIDRFAKRAI